MPKMIDPFLLDNDETYPYSSSMFPVRKEKHLSLVEEKLEKDTRYKCFLIELLMSEVKSNTLVDLVKKTMTWLIDVKVLLGYAVFGKRKSIGTKKDFIALHIGDVVLDSIISRPEYKDSECDVERKIKAHLSQSAYRVSKRLS